MKDVHETGTTSERSEADLSSLKKLHRSLRIALKTHIPEDISSLAEARDAFLETYTAPPAVIAL